VDLVAKWSEGAMRWLVWTETVVVGAGMALISHSTIVGGSDVVANIDGDDMVAMVVILRCCWVESLVWVETAAVVATGLIWTPVSLRMVVGKKQC